MWEAILNNASGIFSALALLTTAIASLVAAVKASKTHAIVSGQNNANSNQGPVQ